MPESRTPRRKGWRAFFDEARRREVHRALAIYGAFVWGVVAAAPDLLQYFGAPSWLFTALLVALALGLPVVAVASWFLDFSVRGERALPEEPERGPPVLLTPADVRRPGVRRTVVLARWGLPIALLVAFPFLVRWFVSGDATGPLAVAVAAEDDLAGVLAPPFQWLLDAGTLPVDPDAGLGAALRSARRGGAGYLVTASAEAPSGTLTLALYDVRSGARIEVLSGGGATEDVHAAAGRLTLQLVRRVSERDGLPMAVDPAVTVHTDVPMAVFHLLEGQRRFGVSEMEAAVAAYRRAIEADPGFVPAYYRLAVAHRWLWAYQEGLEVLDAATARGIPSPGWARLIEAERHNLRRDTGPGLAGYEQATLHYPELREGWLGLGEALFHYGGFVGRDPQESVGPLERALAGDSLFAPVRHHLVDLALWRGDAPEARRTLAATPPEHPIRPILEVALALRHGTPAERSEAWARARGWDLQRLSLLVAHFGFGPAGRPSADSVAAILTSPERRADERLRGAQYRLMLATDSASWARALEGWRSVRGIEPFDSWAVHAHLAGRSIPEAEEMLVWAEGQWRQGIIPDFSLALNHDLRRTFYSLVHWAVLQGDSAEVAALLRSVEAAPPPGESDPGPVVLAAALRGRLALLAGDTAGAVTALEEATSRTFEPYVAFYPASTMAPERLLLLRLNAALGRDNEARRWRDSFYRSHSFGDLLYQAWVDEVGATSPTPPSTEAP